MKITLTNNTDTLEKEGQAVVAFLIKPEVEGDPDSASIVFGQGNPAEMLLRSASALGVLVGQMIDDPIESLLISAKMADVFKKATLGIGVETLGLSKEKRPINDEDADEQGSV